MIQVSVTLQRGEILKSVSVEGHAYFAQKGNDIVCAAVTALARSAAKTLERFQQVSVTGSAEEPGSLQFEVTDLKDGSLEYVRGIGDFFVLGIRDIVKEYPNACSLLVQREIGQEK